MHQAFLFCKPWLYAMDFYALIDLLNCIAKDAIQKETDENGLRCNPDLPRRTISSSMLIREANCVNPETMIGLVAQANKRLADMDNDTSEKKFVGHMLEKISKQAGKHSDLQTRWWNCVLCTIESQVIAALQEHIEAHSVARVAMPSYDGLLLLHPSNQFAHSGGECC